MQFIIIVLALLFGGSAFAGPVIVNGKIFGTGLLRKPVGDDVVYYQPRTSDLPDSFDAREHGLVTAIKNQGSCGSCWAFARTKAFEAALIKAGVATAEELNLAEQDPLVNDRSAYGCSGGFMDATFEVRQGTTTEALCPYRASGRYACRGAKYAKAASWAMLGARGRAPTTEELKAAIVEHGVLAVTVAASSSFSPGRDGRITRCGGRSLNHMVNLVGYRTVESGATEFLIANSWGTSWGQDGFAWSRQGCNKLASVAGDAALVIQVEQ